MAKHNRIVRVDSDGDGNSTVVTMDDGSVLKEVVSAEISLRANSVNEIELLVTGTPVHVEGYIHLVNVSCPLCDHVSAHHCEGKS